MCAASASEKEKQLQKKEKKQLNACSTTLCCCDKRMKRPTLHIVRFDAVHNVRDSWCSKFVLSLSPSLALSLPRRSCPSPRTPRTRWHACSLCAVHCAC